MNQDTRRSLAIEELEQRLEMSSVPVLTAQQEDEQTIKKCTITVEC